MVLITFLQHNAIKNVLLFLSFELFHEGLIVFLFIGLLTKRSPMASDTNGVEKSYEQRWQKYRSNVVRSVKANCVDYQINSLRYVF